MTDVKNKKEAMIDRFLAQMSVERDDSCLLYMADSFIKYTKLRQSKPLPAIKNGRGV